VTLRDDFGRQALAPWISDNRTNWKIVAGELRIIGSTTGKWQEHWAMVPLPEGTRSFEVEMLSSDPLPCMAGIRIESPVPGYNIELGATRDGEVQWSTTLKGTWSGWKTLRTHDMSKRHRYTLGVARDGTFGIGIDGVVVLSRIEVGPADSWTRGLPKGAVYLQTGQAVFSPQISFAHAIARDEFRP
jgi:hypothetical protein